MRRTLKDTKGRCIVNSEQFWGRGGGGEVYERECMRIDVKRRHEGIIEEVYEVRVHVQHGVHVQIQAQVQ